VAPEVKYGRRRGLENSDAWINLAFSVRLAERYQATGGKDFIKSMHCKAVTALPRAKTGPLRSNSTVIVALGQKAKDRSRCFLSPRKCSTDASLGLWKPSPRSRTISFSTENLSPYSQGRPSFQVLQNNLSRSLPVYIYCFDLLNLDGETFMTLPIERRRALLHGMLSSSKDRLRLSPLLRAPSGQVLEAVRKLGLEGVVGKTDRFDLRTPASDQARGSSSARTWSKSSSSAVTSAARAASMRCS
jgi:hypothetical protein